ncbi:MAG: hypothetical protein ACH346_01800 [Chthoniobacterales bacterium]
MKILLTLDLDQPSSPERQASHEILRHVWDQLQVTNKKDPSDITEAAPQQETSHSLEILCTEGKSLDHGEYSLAEWAAAACSLKNAEQYRTLAPSPLESYDLIIAANLAPGPESLFNSLRIPTLILRDIPCENFDHFLLARANFTIPKEYCTLLPPLKNLYSQDIPTVDVSKEERHWWLANRFLINQKSKNLSILAIGTTTCQTERVVNGKIINLSCYASELIDLIPSYPNFYYCSRPPMDHSELRFIKTLNASGPSLSLPQLLARDEIDSLISIDTGMVPVAEAFQKPIKLLGNHPSWSVIRLRQFRDSEFLAAITKQLPR